MLWWLMRPEGAAFDLVPPSPISGFAPDSAVGSVAGAGYLAALLAAVVANAVGNDEDPTLGVIASVLMLTVWIGGMVHAQLVRDEVRGGAYLLAGVPAAEGGPRPHR